MAGRSRDTYKKRQKEVARAEKAKEKAARRVERKLHKGDSDLDDIDELVLHEDGTPVLNEDGTPMYRTREVVRESTEEAVVPSLGSSAGQ